MWPDSTFARPVSSFQHPVPVVNTDPGADPQVFVCFNKEWLPYIIGSLKQLVLQTTWQTTDADTLWLVQQRAMTLMSIFAQAKPCSDHPTESAISLEELMSQQIRLKPGDPCIIQMWCIDDWVDWYDPRGCIANSLAQPTNGGALSPGECRSWDVLLDGNETWLLPVPVQAGDTIEISGTDGAWNDGTLSWYCPDGSGFQLGACIPFCGSDPSAPLPGACIMALVANVDGTWFSAYNTTIGVPSGTVDGQVTFQANDATLSDNSGRISFTVKYCAAQTVTPPITISYPSGLGVGPTTINPGDVFSVTAVDNAGGGHNQYVDMEFSREVKVTVLGVSGFSLNPGFGSGTVFGQIKNTAGTVLQSLVVGTNTTPSDYTPQDHVHHWDAGGGNSVWTLTVKVEDF